MELGPVSGQHDRVGLREVGQKARKQVLKDYRPDNDLFPSYHIPKLREAAQDKYATELAELKAASAARKAAAPAAE